jgi:CheY-like chemotaxis protein
VVDIAQTAAPKSVQIHLKYGRERIDRRVQSGERHMLKVLIAEDELMIADMIEETLLENGYEVCGIARTVDEAVALVRDHKPDLAVIDLRLADGGFGTEIAAQFEGPDRFGILYASGNVSRGMLGAANGEAYISKPYGTPRCCAVWKLSPTSSPRARRHGHSRAGSICWKRPPRQPWVNYEPART